MEILLEKTAEYYKHIWQVDGFIFAAGGFGDNRAS